MINQIKKQTKEDIKDSCSEIVTTAKEEIQKAIDESTSDLHEATVTVRNNSTKNTLLNFVCAIVLCVAATCGITYAQNYRDGTAIAEAKSVEALAAERAKFAEEMKTEKLNLKTKLAQERNRIEENAINDYKASIVFREDASKFVAYNITKLDVGYYLYTYTKSEDIKNWKEIKTFYKEYLKGSFDEYKKMKVAQ